MPLLTALAVIALADHALCAVHAARAARLARGLAFAVLLFALSGPLLVREKHAPLTDVAVIVTDRSQSMVDRQPGGRRPKAPASRSRSFWRRSRA